MLYVFACAVTTGMYYGVGEWFFASVVVLPGLVASVGLGAYVGWVSWGVKSEMGRVEGDVELRVKSDEEEEEFSKV